jgi:nucleotide-binding universal stress UspA family protein
MYRTLLVPLDGSSLAERAMPYAIFLARSSAARVLLLRAVAAPVFAMGDPTAGINQEMRDADDYLERVATSVAGPVVVETATFPGDAAEAITWEINLRKVDLAVMSTHGRSGLGRWVYGSVADAVVRRAASPVLLVPAATAREWAGGRPFRILVPLDGSDLSSKVLAPASGLASLLGAHVTLLYAAEPLTRTFADASTYTEYDPTAVIEAARGHLESVASRLRDDGNAVTVVTAVGTAAETIARIARDEMYDLIAMSTQGSGGLTRLVMGSVTASVVQQASVPVLVVRPTATVKRATQLDARHDDGERPHPAMT